MTWLNLAIGDLRADSGVLWDLQDALSVFSNQIKANTISILFLLFPYKIQRRIGIAKKKEKLRRVSLTPKNYS